MALRSVLRTAGGLGIRVAGFIVGLAVAELLLRMLGISYPPRAAFFEPDNHTGWAHKAEAAGDWRYEGFSQVRISGAGLRDRGHSPAKPVSVFRVAVLGDSMTEAFQVPQESGFCSVLEGALRHCAALKGRAPEVINFGVMGYGTGQELIALRRRVWQYSPDMVVLAFFPGNDLYDNSRSLQDFAPAERLGPRPYFYYEGGRLQLDNSFRNSPHFLEVSERAVYDSSFRRFLWNFRIWQLIYHLHYSGPLASIWRAARVVETAWTNGRVVPDGFAGPERSDRYSLNPPSEKAWREAWQVTEGLITQMDAEVEKTHTRFLVVVLSEALQVYPGRTARDGLLRKARVGDPFYPNRRLEALAEQRGFSLLSLGEPLQKYADEHDVFLHGFSNCYMGVGHLNEAGHELTGQLIANRICTMMAPALIGAGGVR